MNDPMTVLNADHREVKRMLTVLADSDEGPERETLVGELATALRLHMDLEEQLVYPLVVEHVGDDDGEEAEVEHGLAREGLDKLVAMVAQPGFGAVVEMLQGGIGHHVTEEENELLPALKDALDRDAWRALGDAIVEAKTAAGAPPPRAPAKRSAKRTTSAKKTAAKKKAART